MDVNRLVGRSLPQYAAIEAAVLDIMGKDQSVVISPSKITMIGNRKDPTPFIAVYDSKGQISLKRHEALIFGVRNLLQHVEEVISIGIIGTWENGLPVIEVHLVWLDDENSIVISDWSKGSEERHMVPTTISAVLDLRAGQLHSPRIARMNRHKRWQAWPRDVAVHGQPTIYHDKLEERFGITEPNRLHITRHCPTAPVSERIA